MVKIQSPQLCSPICIITMVKSYWSKACTAQYNRPHLQLANYGGSIFAVSEASTWHLGLLLCGAAAAAVLMLALNAAIAAVPHRWALVTRRAGRFICYCCDIQWRVVPALGEGFWEGGDVGAAGIVQRDGVCGQHCGCRCLGREHPEQ